MFTVEMLLKDGTDVRSKVFTNALEAATAYKSLLKNTVPFKVHGICGDGQFVSVEKNGWNDEDVVLTADAKFGNGKTYSYVAGKRYSGLYEVKTKFGESVVSVSYRYRDIDEFRAEIWEAGYDEPVSFESILIKKVH